MCAIYPKQNKFLRKVKNLYCVNNYCIFVNLHIIGLNLVP